MESEVVAVGYLCSCGGIIDKRQIIQKTPKIWQGKCFVCGKPFTVLNWKTQK